MSERVVFIAIGKKTFTALLGEARDTILANAELIALRGDVDGTMKQVCLTRDVCIELMHYAEGMDVTITEIVRLLFADAKRRGKSEPTEETVRTFAARLVN